MRAMFCFLLLVVGMAVGIFIMQAGAAQQEKVASLRLNHFGISVKDVGESMNFYTKTMGFREAFSSPSVWNTTMILGVSRRWATISSVALTVAMHASINGV